MWTYTDWYPGQPDADSAQGYGCITLFNDGVVGSTPHFADRQCIAETAQFICEQQACNCSQ